MATLDEINMVLGILSAAYPNFPLTPETGKVYMQFLADLDYPLLDQAVKAHVATNKWFPSIAEIRESVTTLSIRASGVPTALEAWGEVVDKMIRYGNTVYGGEVPDFSHPLVARVVGYMGWNDLCLSENSIADRARFIQCFDAEVSRASYDTRLLPETRNMIESSTGREIRLLSERLTK